MNTDSYDQYYRDSRGYSWSDLAQMRRQPLRSSAVVPEVFRHRFSDPAAYDAWVEEQRKRYFA